MKKLVLGMACLASLALSAQAQNTEFKPSWYIQGQVGVGHTIGESSFRKLLSPAAALNLGYRFSPLFGVRIGASGWQAKGAWAATSSVYKYKYLQGSSDLTMDLGTLFAGYNADRVFNPYVFAGGGLIGGFHNGEAGAEVARGHNLEYYWARKKVFLAGRAGLGANIRLSRAVALTGEVNANVTSDKFNSKKAGNPDWQFNALVGLTFTFGKRSAKPAEVVDYTPVAVEHVESAPVQQPVKEEVKQETPAPVAVVEEVRENVFFLINSSVIRKQEMVKVDKLVAYLKEHSDKKIRITGYADVQTGNESINDHLSEKRAEAVKKAMIKKGVAADRIMTDYKGDNEQPFSVNDQNRVAICIAE